MWSTAAQWFGPPDPGSDARVRVAVVPSDGDRKSSRLPYCASTEPGVVAVLLNRLGQSACSQTATDTRRLMRSPGVPPRKELAAYRAV
jgi:hypothetical protein